MAGKALFLGIDAGTQSISVAVYDSSGSMISEVTRRYPTDYLEDGQILQDPADWIEGLLTALRHVVSTLTAEQKNMLSSCTVCATSSTVVSLDRNLQPIEKAKMWMDVTASDQAGQINRTNHEQLTRCGGEVSPEWLIPKILWLKQENPQQYDDTAIFVEQLDYINYMLTGVICSSACNAICKANYGPDSYAQDFMEIVGFEDYQTKLPKTILSVGSPVGLIRKEILDTVGLPDKEIIVYQGGIDAHIALIGMGVVRANEMGMILGTSFVHFVLAENMPRQRLHGVWGPYENVLFPGYALIESGQVSASSLSLWYRSLFGIEGAGTFETLRSEAVKAGPGAEGLRALDHFAGNRTPYKDPLSSGLFFGLRLHHRREHIYRALLESVACGTRLIIENNEKQIGKIKRFVACGGVTQDEIWMQIIADMCRCDIEINRDHTNGGTLGCAMIGAVSSGIHQNYEAAAKKMVHQQKIIRHTDIDRAIYDDVYADYIHLYENNRNIRS